MSLEGNAEAGYVLRGKIHGIPNAVIDKTLTKEGLCADAKATGDAIADAKSLASYASKNALQALNQADNAWGYAVGAMKNSKPPSLTDEQKTELVTLAKLYTNSTASTSSPGHREDFWYVGNTLRDAYVGDDPDNTPFVNAFKRDDGANLGQKVKVNCGLYVGLLWAGVNPTTFTDYIGNQSGFDGTLVKNFNWGYEFKYPNRHARYKKESASKVYGFLNPNEKEGEEPPVEGWSLVGSSGYNSFYTEKAEEADIVAQMQKFYSYATAADMAWELYSQGYEVQMKDIEVGDLLFFRARSLSDNMDDYDEAIRFRNITHVAMVTDIATVEDNVFGSTSTKNGNFVKKWSITEATSMISTRDYQVANLLHTSNTASTVTRLAYLNNKICMVARHPAAYGVESNLGDKFRKLF